jgi:pimeloyl-ACP methyl ester carboxylesterase
MAASPLDQILAVTRFAQRAVGVDPVVAAGNCLGAQAALALAAELPECTGAVCMLPPVVKSGVMLGLIERAQGGRIQVRLRSNRLLRRLVVRPLERFDLTVRPAVGEPLLRALKYARVLFLYDQSNLASRSRAFPKVRALVSKLPEQHRSRFELRVLPSRGLQQFATIDVQETALAALVEWADRCLPQAKVSVPVHSSAPTGDRSLQT